MSAPPPVLDLMTLGRLDRQDLASPGAPRRSRLAAPWHDRRLRFVIETRGAIGTADEILGAVARAMGAEGLGPDAVATSLAVEPLFRGAERDDATDGLGRYSLLVVPLAYRYVLLLARQRVGVLWDLAYAIRQAGGPEVVAVEPDLPATFYPGLSQASLPGCRVGEAAAPPEVDWARRLVRLDRVPAPVPTGRGVVIGHVDTGHSDHRELNRGERYDLSADLDLIDGDDDASEPITEGGSHGTATASLIVSRHDTTWIDADGAPRPGLDGVAPESTLVAVRAIESVVVIGGVDVARAVWHCIARGVHVINLSLGGYALSCLEAAVAQAVNRERIIVVAAAGNCWPFVVYPAAYAEVIACAGVGLDPRSREPRVWAGSAAGEAVDIAAPAENVYVADFDPGGHQVVRPGEGTSYAAPHVAGIAALWLERHGRDALLARYDGVPLGEVFRHLIRVTARAGHGWNTRRHGAGIIDAAAVLAAPLPPASLFKTAPSRWMPMTEQDIAYGLFDFHPRTLDFLDELIDDARMPRHAFLHAHGREFNQLVSGSEEAWRAFSAGLEAMTVGGDEAPRAIAEVVGAFVEAVSGAASDALWTAAGWPPA